MASSVFPVDQYKFSGKESLLFDTNVWLFILGPQYDETDDSRTAPYSSGFRRILEAKASIFIDALILSEFINSCARYEYNIIPADERPPTFKMFRKSPLFRTVAQDIAVRTRKIMGFCNRTDSGFGTLDMDSLLNDFETGKKDFNDQVLEDLCVRRGFNLVTDDSDFKAANLTLFTANFKLLNP
ncbi:MAG: type II toxin-antitoxin system VapC family toxin [Desulfomonilaceae bacterium]